MSNVDLFLYLRRSFSAPRDLVFRAWTEPAALENWFRPLGRRTKVLELDLRVGGGYRFEAYDASGVAGDSLLIAGRYVEIVRPQKLAFTWRSVITDQHETLVTLDFLERAGSTEIALRHERFPAEQMRTAHQVGWNGMFENLGSFVSPS